MTLCSNIPNKEFWKGKNVLVTGHTGFKGSWLCLWLLKMGAKVSGISLDPESSKNHFDSLNIKREINHIICDIRNRENLKSHLKQINPEIIFHLAAQPLVLTSYEEPVETWEVNVLGTINLLDSIRTNKNECIAILITTDKVYQNKEWIHGYRENDRLGGYDPYSSSKAAAELAIKSWRSSFFNLEDKNPGNNFFAFSSARAGNVIGGGDWSKNRIIPDLVNALHEKKEIIIRNPSSTRPWQHVIEPLSGYLRLAEKLYENPTKYSTSYNFGPHINSNKTVQNLVEESLKEWPGKFKFSQEKKVRHEAKMLNLVIEKAIKELEWEPFWDFGKTINKTISWYKKVLIGGESALSCSLSDLNDYLND